MPAAAEAAPQLPTLADVAALTRESDYSRFMATGVDGSVRNAALKKLFSDPHFNIMDGLDTYIDDYNKPDPLPLLHAARELGVAIEGCVYVGDDERDIIAARAARMISIVALWGYRLEGDDPVSWQGDAMVASPCELLDPVAWPYRQ